MNATRPLGGQAAWVVQRALLARYDQAIVDELRPFLGRRLLEVGCGVGTMTRYLADRDLLVAVVNVARKVKVDPELALRSACGRFRERVERAVQLAIEESER